MFYVLFIHRFIYIYTFKPFSLFLPKEKHYCCFFQLFHKLIASSPDPNIRIWCITYFSPEPDSPWQHSHQSVTTVAAPITAEPEEPALARARGCHHQRYKVTSPTLQQLPALPPSVSFQYLLHWNICIRS